MQLSHSAATTACSSSVSMKSAKLSKQLFTDSSSHLVQKRHHSHPSGLFSQQHIVAPAAAPTPSSPPPLPQSPSSPTTIDFTMFPSNSGSFLHSNLASNNSTSTNSSVFKANNLSHSTVPCDHRLFSSRLECSPDSVAPPISTSVPCYCDDTLSPVGQHPVSAPPPSHARLDSPLPVQSAASFSCPLHLTTSPPPTCPINPQPDASASRIAFSSCSERVATCCPTVGLQSSRRSTLNSIASSAFSRLSSARNKLPSQQHQLLREEVTPGMGVGKKGLRMSEPVSSDGNPQATTKSHQPRYFCTLFAWIHQTFCRFTYFIGMTFPI
ncbi:unnamed protein product [Protopolystoma xenopodis]|uniref:Uncharacterized protein n=1 Tax=Protopolystoma xenopodis TaxID=117903 RepID=A0A448WZ98_9PLAT|nr:unnamed protein product [Protopolystoma xenopodis]